MKILYLSQININLNESGIYQDLLNSLVQRGHEVYLVSADSSADKTENIIADEIKRIIVKTGNQFGVNIIKKGIVLLSLENKYIKAINKYIKDDKIDLVLYSTPPVTFAKVIDFCKKKFKCKSYLMLKDIFPQNAVDLGMMNKKGVSAIIYKYFRGKEKRLYALSDKIGCMSGGNIDYLLRHNQISKEKVELFPNSLTVKDAQIPDKSILSQYNCIDKTTFIFGGNLGVPQGLGFLAEAFKQCKDLDAHFFIVGKGSEKEKLTEKLKEQNNVTIIDFLPVFDYNRLCNACDVGIISLDPRFTIPNYPSRILSYMENAMPVLASTDNVTDIKELVQTESSCGKWNLNGDFEGFKNNVQWFCENPAAAKEMGLNGRKYFEDNFDVMKHLYKIENMGEGADNV